jgi:hypothetical protein
MTRDLMTYYIPNNPNIPKGHIYTLYLNNNTNLDLSSILNLQTVTVSNILQSASGPIQATSQITMSQEDYTKLLELNNQAFQLTTKRTADIQSFIQAETKTTAELAKINSERQELIKRLTKKGPTQ